MNTSTLMRFAIQSVALLELASTSVTAARLTASFRKVRIPLNSGSSQVTVPSKLPIRLDYSRLDIHELDEHDEGFWGADLRRIKREGYLGWAESLDKYTPYLNRLTADQRFKVAYDFNRIDRTDGIPARAAATRNLFAQFLERNFAEKFVTVQPVLTT